MKTVFLVILFFAAHFSFGQLNCKNLKGVNGDSTICFHQNGKISSITSASLVHPRYWNFKSFDTYGNQVYKTDFGLLHGSSGLDVTYYSNGALKSARRTFQPDGGIQHYDVTTFFKEDGTFDHEEDNSWDRMLIEPYVEPKRKPGIEIKEDQIQNKDSIEFWIVNSTKQTVKILVGKMNSSEAKNIIKIKAHSQFKVDSYLNSKKEVNPLSYFEIDLLPNKKLKKGIEISYQNKLSSKNKAFVYIFEKPE